MAVQLGVRHTQLPAQSGYTPGWEERQECEPPASRSAQLAPQSTVRDSVRPVKH